MTSVFLVGYEVTSEVRFSYVSPDFDHAFRRIIIKPAVVPCGDSRVDPQTTLTIMSKTEGTILKKCALLWFVLGLPSHAILTQLKNNSSEPFSGLSQGNEMLSKINEERKFSEF